ncbi:MAG: TIGR00282 family metallophosphoesterase [Aquificae bacterium]|nr:TIGR00282 family metallophosphoesterase [Aquificota bacterium]
MRILAVGDIIGKPGRKALREFLPQLKDEIAYDAVIVNVENAAGGFGLTQKVYEELLELGVDVMTSGNHIWDRKEIYSFIDDAHNLLRPANYPEGVPGRGFGIFKKNGVVFGVINLMGKVFMECNLENPFGVFDEIYEEIRKETNIVVVDFHAEATSEKWAFGIYVDGRASAVFGTHTHIPTADEFILKKGTGYVSDVGMSGVWYSVIGVKPAQAIERLKLGVPRRFEVEEKGQVVFNAVLFDIDESTGKTISIERIKRFL